MQVFCKQVQVCWPPQQPDAALPDLTASAKQEAAPRQAPAEAAGFSSETLAILSSLGGGNVAPVQTAESPQEESALVSCSYMFHPVHILLTTNIWLKCYCDALKPQGARI